MNKIFRISALVLLLCLTSGIAAADEELPQIPEEFWGSVSINGVPAPAGTAISATIDGQEVGSVVTTDKGSYGGASRQEGEHLLISANSGMIDHEITFLVNGNPADQTEIFTPDNAKELDLTVTTKEPVAGFTASPTSGNAPLKVTFTDTSTGNPDSWLWDFGDGTSATGQDAGHTYNSAGKFSVRLTVSNIYGSSSTSATITVSSSGGGGTGGGGSGGSTGGGVISPSTVQVQTATTTGTLSTDSAGVIQISEEVVSSDEKAALLISSGTTALAADGSPLSEVTIREVGPESVPTVTSGTTFAFNDMYFSCTPEGATFSPSIDLIFQLTEEEYNSLESGESFSIRYYDETAGQWEEIPTTVNPNTFQVIGGVSHFSTYALMVDEAGAGVVTASPTATTAAPDIEATTAEPSSPGTGGEEGIPVWIWLAVIVIIFAVLGAGWWYYNNKDESNTENNENIDNTENTDNNNK